MTVPPMSSSSSPSSLVSDGEAALLDADGTALVIHAEPDDHLTQPIGGSGPRIACAVFVAP